MVGIITIAKAKACLFKKPDPLKSSKSLHFKLDSRSPLDIKTCKKASVWLNNVKLKTEVNIE